MPRSIAVVSTTRLHATPTSYRARIDREDAVQRDAIRVADTLGIPAAALNPSRLPKLVRSFGRELRRCNAPTSALVFAQSAARTARFVPATTAAALALHLRLARDGGHPEVWDAWEAVARI